MNTKCIWHRIEERFLPDRAARRIEADSRVQEAVRMIRDGLAADAAAPAASGCVRPAGLGWRPWWVMDPNWHEGEAPRRRGVAA